MSASPPKRQARLDPESVEIVEPVIGSDRPVHLIYVVT
jgi:hypothetical protein